MLIRRPITRVAVVGLAAAVALSTSTVGVAANAAPATSASDSAVSQHREYAGVADEELTASELKASDDLAAEVEELFEGAMVENEQGAYVFDYEKAEKNLGKAKADEIQAEVDRLEKAEESNQTTKAGGDRQARASGGYVTCVLEKAGYGTLVGLFTGAYKELIEKKLWKEVAKVIVKTVGASAVKGGVVGLAASLTVAAGWCAWFD